MRQEVTKEWRKLHNDLHTYYSSLDIIRGIKSRRERLIGYIARMGDMRNAYKISIGKLEGVKLTGRSRPT